MQAAVGVGEPVGLQDVGGGAVGVVESATVKFGENSEVFPFASVAVAVITSPAATPPSPTVNLPSPPATADPANVRP